MFIYNPFFLTVLSYYCFEYYLYGAIRAVNLTNTAAGAFMFIIFIVWHYHFTFEPLKHYKIFPVFGIFLGDNFARAEKIPVGDPHPVKQRPDSLYYFSKILNYTIHLVVIISVPKLRNANPSEPGKP